MKKRLFAILLCLIAIMTLCVFPVTASAESAVDEIASENGEIDNSSHTLFTRMWEFFSAYSSETISVMGSAVLLVFNFVLKRSNSKASKDTDKSLHFIKEEISATHGSQNAVVSVVNNMIDGYNSLSQKYDAMNESYELYGATEDERNRIVGAVFATNTAILEILTTVYVNSKNLPQGVKDIVNLKYANCLKALDDDTQLRAIVEAVRNNIGKATESSEDTTENAEV